MAADDTHKSVSDAKTVAPPKRDLPDCAVRALKEAEERRQAAAALAAPETAPDELSGPKGAEPTRYGDWERKGIAYDF